MITNHKIKNQIIGSLVIWKQRISKHANRISRLNHIKEGSSRLLVKMSVLLMLFVTCLPVCPVQAAAAKLNRQKQVLYTGEHAGLSVSGKRGSVRWKSSNRKVASVDKKGIVTGRRKGTAKITATVGKKKLTCAVTVKTNPAEEAVRKARSITAGSFSCTRRPGNTPIYTGVAKIDYLAEALTREMGITSGMSDEQVVKRIYMYMSKYFYYATDLHFMDLPRQYYDVNALETKAAAFEEEVMRTAARGEIRFTDKFTMSTWTSLSSEGAEEMKVVMDDISAHIAWHEGVCDNHADIFSVLCCHLGIEAGIAGGTLNGNSHAWSWAKVNGKKYYYDIGSAIHYYFRNKKASMGYYRMKKKNMKNYRFRSEY